MQLDGKRDCEVVNGTLDIREQTLKRLTGELSELTEKYHRDKKRWAETISKLSKGVAEGEELKRKYSDEMARSRRLFNELQELKGNIRVFCRCHPLNQNEMSSGYKAIVDFDTARDGEIGILTGGATKKTFKFDRIFIPKDNQADVYADASPMVMSVLDGYNVSIFAYGQTGTGKTSLWRELRGNKV